MAGEQILHNAKEIVDEGGFVANNALRDSGVTANGIFVAVTANAYGTTKTTVHSVTVDAKGRVTAASTTSANLTGITFGSNTTNQAHIADQKIYIATAGPGAGDGANGDIWYQTLS
tara:strand:+ start:1193 stop:1540 length:348 start_codon:yes stop_codon:yes gene_type:complete